VLAFVLMSYCAGVCVDVLLCWRLCLCVIVQVLVLMSYCAGV